MIQKSFSAETKVLDPAKGLVECVFSVTGVVDRQNDKILPGAFQKALALKQSVPVVYAHVWNDINAVLGKTVGWTELMPGDSRLGPQLQGKGYGGVKATVQFDQETPSGRLALTHVANRNIKDWSFAFDIDDDGAKTAEYGSVREIKSVREIFEVTLALIGANQEAMTLAVQKTIEMQRVSSSRPAWSNSVKKKADLVREVRTLVARVEREPQSPEKETVLAAARVLFADEDETERNQWGRIFNYVRSLD